MGQGDRFGRGQERPADWPRPARDDDLAPSRACRMLLLRRLLVELAAPPRRALDIYV